MPDEHVCTCMECAPDERLRGARQGDRHFGVRFGHTGSVRYVPTLNGEAQPYAFESFVGDSGWVAVWRLKDFNGTPQRHICHREPRPHACYEIREGLVEMPGLLVPA